MDGGKGRTPFPHPHPTHTHIHTHTHTLACQVLLQSSLLRFLPCSELGHFPFESSTQKLGAVALPLDLELEKNCLLILWDSLDPGTANPGIYAAMLDWLFHL